MAISLPEYTAKGFGLGIGIGAAFILYYMIYSILSFFLWGTVVILTFLQETCVLGMMQIFIVVMKCYTIVVNAITIHIILTILVLALLAYALKLEWLHREIEDENGDAYDKGMSG